MRCLIALLLLLVAALPAHAQTVRLPNTESAACTLDSVNDICAVNAAGQQSAFVRIPSGGNLVGTIKPVISLLSNPSFADPTHWLEDRAAFKGAGQPVASIVLANPNDPVEHQIIADQPALWIGIKVDAYTSGSIATPKVWAVFQQPLVFVVGDKAGMPAVFPLEDISGTTNLRVSVGHTLTTWGDNRSHEDVVDALNDEVILNVEGAGQVRFITQSGRTGESRAECRLGTNSWVGVPVLMDTGEVVAGGVSWSTYPKEGQFLITGFTECKIRAHTHTSGTHTPRLEVSPGAGLVRTAAADSSAPCYITSAASTNSTNCKTTAGAVTGIRAINTTATKYYLRMYNLAAAPTCSSATGFVETIPVPASTDGSGVAFPIIPGQRYDTGIGFCLTGGGSSTDNTNAATGVYLTINYR